MLGAIAGDIIGSRFEGQAGPARDFALFHADCRFTDDTVCAVAIADALLREGDFAASLRKFSRRHRSRGFSPTFLRWALAEDAPAYGSWGNGAPMRVAAVGWLADDEQEALRWAAEQAEVSHNHPGAVTAAQSVALAILLARRGCSRPAIRDRLIAQFGYDLDPARALVGGGFDISAAGTVPPALAAALDSEDWESSVRTVVCLGGDTDTLACISGAVAEAIHGLPASIADATRRYLTQDLQTVLGRFDKAMAQRRRD